MAINLAQLLASVEQQDKQITQTASALQGAYGSQAGALGSAASATRQAGSAAAVIKEQEERGLLEAQRNARAMATASGTNISESNEIMTLLGVQQAQASMELIRQAEHVQRITDQSNLGNPLGLIYDILYGDDARASLGAAENKLTAVTNSIQSLNNSTQTVAQTQRAIADTRSEATVMATRELALATAEANAAEIQARMAGVDVARINALHGLAGEQLGNQFKAFQVQEMVAEREARRALADKAAKEAAADERRQDALMELYNLGAVPLNLPKVNSIEEFQIQLEVAEAGKRLDPTRGSPVDMAVSKGSELKHLGSISLGRTPLESLANQQTYGIQVAPNQTEVLGYMQTKLAEFEADPGGAMRRLDSNVNSTDFNSMYSRITKDQDKNVFRNEYINKAFAKDAQDIRFDDPSNIVALAPINTLSGAAILDSNPFLTKYVKSSVESAAATGEPVAFDPGKYLNAAARDLASGELTHSQVTAGLQEMFQVLYGESVLAKGMSSTFSLPYVDEYNVVTTTYTPPQGPSPSATPFSPVQYRAGAPLRHTATVNWLDPASVNEYVAGYLRKLTAMDMIRGSHGN